MIDTSHIDLSNPNTQERLIKAAKYIVLYFLKSHLAQKWQTAIAALVGFSGVMLTLWWNARLQMRLERRRESAEAGHERRQIAAEARLEKRVLATEKRNAAALERENKRRLKESRSLLRRLFLTELPIIISAIEIEMESLDHEELARGLVFRSEFWRDNAGRIGCLFWFEQKSLTNGYGEFLSFCNFREYIMLKYESTLASDDVSIHRYRTQKLLKALEKARSSSTLGAIFDFDI